MRNIIQNIISYFDLLYQLNNASRYTVLSTQLINYIMFFKYKWPWYDYNIGTELNISSGFCVIFLILFLFII